MERSEENIATVAESVQSEPVPEHLQGYEVNEYLARVYDDSAVLRSYEH